MISDETFPIELEEEFITNLSPEPTFRGPWSNFGSTEASGSSNISPEPCTSSDTSFPLAESLADGTTEKEFPESSFVAFKTSSNQLSLLSPHAPSKKKKSSSYQDLRKNHKYDHVESKVKKLIQNMNSDDRKRKISRHKSMPISSQPQLDDTFSEEKDTNVLVSELRKKSIKIYEVSTQRVHSTERGFPASCQRRMNSNLTEGLLRLSILL